MKQPSQNQIGFHKTLKSNRKKSFAIKSVNRESIRAMAEDFQQDELTEANTRLTINDYEEGDSTIHDFNRSNITVIERSIDTSNTDHNAIIKPAISYEGSDSGVEVVENCSLKRTSSINSTNSQEFGGGTPACSYESSIISCCSNYEEAYNLLARRNSTLLEDYNIRNCDGTSEGGSESSSVTGSSSSRNRANLNTAKKKFTNEMKNKNVSSTSRSRSRPPVTPKNSSTNIRSNKITEKDPNKQSNNKPAPKTANLRLNVASANLLVTSPNDKAESTKKKGGTTSRGSSSTRTPATTPTDDGRWPSINSKPAPLLAKSALKFVAAQESIIVNNKRNGTPPINNKFASIEKYATLPRRRKEKSADNLKDLQNKAAMKENILHRGSMIKRQSSRDSTTPKSFPPHPRRRNFSKTKIYHEIGNQTALTQTDIERAFAGVTFKPALPEDVEKSEKNVQVDVSNEQMAKLQDELKQLKEEHEKLWKDYIKESGQLLEAEENLKEEKLEKRGLKNELRLNTERVLAILGDNSSLPNDENAPSASLLLLESRYEKVGQLVINQEKELSELRAHCRSLQRYLDRSESERIVMSQQHSDHEMETKELQEFMQAEKSTLAEALKDAENEIKALKLHLVKKEKEIENKTEESRMLIRVSEQRRQENLGLINRLGSFEAQSREILIYQGGHISSASVALAALIARLDGLVEELVVSYGISEADLEDVIFHNEAYTNSSSSPDATPEKNSRSLKEQSPSPKRGSSFVSVIINAIRNATAQTSFSVSKEISKDTISLANSDSTEMLDSETEPCLMMEPVLEDVFIPDGHSHNMISFGHGLRSSTRLVQSESLNNLSQTMLQRQYSEHQSLSLTESLNCSFNDSEIPPSLTELSPVPLVDQVIQVDNLVTRLLKVLRIIQIENDEAMNELQAERDDLSEQSRKKNEANKIVVKQLRDWEMLGAHLKREVNELMHQLSRKNNEIDGYKTELNQHRKEIERLGEDVCTLSTACSKSEIELKSMEFIKQREGSSEMPSKDVLPRLIESQKEIVILKGVLEEKDQQLLELRKEFLTSRNVLSKNCKEAIGEAKKLYNAIDGALEILHSIQTVVQQCPSLAKLQRDLEETSFQSASSMPIVALSDFNTKGTVLKTVSDLEIPSPINSPA